MQWSTLCLNALLLIVTPTSQVPISTSVGHSGKKRRPGPHASVYPHRGYKVDVDQVRGMLVGKGIGPHGFLQHRSSSCERMTNRRTCPVVQRWLTFRVKSHVVMVESGRRRMKIGRWCDDDHKVDVHARTSPCLIAAIAK